MGKTFPPARALAVSLAFAAAGCGGLDVPPEALVPQAETPRYSAAEALRAFEAEPAAYRLGEGDLLDVNVWERADLTGAHVVGPDGVITLPVAGPIKVAGLTREEAAAACRTVLSKYYADVSVTVGVSQYVSNRVFVLGRVRTPGVQQLSTAPTLLEALSRAGGPVQEGAGALSHCAVIRGRERLAWIDLRRLLENGDLSLNVSLRANDVVLVPEWEEAPVYVLGQVVKPGPVRWSAGMLFTDAVGRAGGLTPDADGSAVHIVRPSENLRYTVSFSTLLSPDAAQNAVVKPGDVVYAPMNGIAEIGYVIHKLNPFSWIFLARAF